MPTVNLNIGTH